MPTTRSQTRSMNMLGNPHSQPATVPAESPFAAIYSTAAINRNSSLFNDQASTTQPGISRSENESKILDGQPGSASLFGNRTPSNKNTRSFIAGDENIPSPSTDNENTPSGSAGAENTLSLFAGNGNPLSRNEKTSLFALCSPPRPPPLTLFGVRMDYRPGPKPNSQVTNPNQQSNKEDNLLPPDEYATSLLERILKVDEILKDVNCLDELTEDVVRKLMATDFGLLTIMKFEVTLFEWADWSEPMKLKGLPVDLNNDGWDHITIQCGRGIRKQQENPESGDSLAVSGGAFFPVQKELSSSGWGPKPRDRKGSGRLFAFKYHELVRKHNGVLSRLHIVPKRISSCALCVTEQTILILQCAADPCLSPAGGKVARYKAQWTSPSA
ncbi:hypothetical protein PISL3812_08678 [Talaromyces islandicus]|uniref:Uncharacterized protein n=1 Tax=Talaromyces islandicus TaxID=28573 RepID=A0A0U1M7X5_TALIS|nr:hypothetical protein PISL3812_08678 [Talaromyces islandicus]